MIQTAALPSIDSPPTQRARRTTIWGLTAPELHDAYWRARGIQCIRRGWRVPIDRDAELYLLVHPNQLVLFDIAAISPRLQWHDAAVTRLRLIDADDDAYSERILLDEDGFVSRIQRQYNSGRQGVSYVALTESRRIASMWMSATGRREAWDRVRRSVSWSRVAHWRSAGHAYRADEPGDEELLLSQLIRRWSNPDQVIEGLTEHESGVWSRDGADVPDVTRIGPLWIGMSADSGGRRCLVGPAWLPDASNGAVPEPATIRSIAEVELAVIAGADGTPRREWLYPLVKRTFDIAVSAALLLLFAPIMGLVALVILIQDGRPIFFGHRRQGRGGGTFRCWKFRTMQVNAEQMARELDEYNLCDGPQVFIQNDPRVTRIGRVLRTSHLDELPQFWNVLVGQMSLVGPRPSPDDENQYCPAWRDLRLSVRPGITGLWQVKRTREPGEDFQEWIKFDIEYVRRASMWLDLRILIWTGLAFFLGSIDSAVE